MRKSVLLYFFIVLQVSLAVGQTYSVPDTNFRKYLQTKVPTAFNTNDELIISQAKLYFGDISCAGMGITDMSGLEYFHNIYLLNCTDNEITFLPSLDSLTNLRQCWVHNNQLVQLPDLSKLTRLTILNVKNNQLSSIPSLSTLTLLKELDCSGNQLTTLPDLDNLSNLEVLYAYSNKLKVIPPILNLTKLRIFNVIDNQLTTLPEITNNIQIQVLRCDKNQLQKLPSFSHLTVLKELGFARNSVSTFPELPFTTNLKILDAHNNNLKEVLDFTMLDSCHVNLSENELTFSSLFPLTSLSNFDNLFVVAPQKPINFNTTLDFVVGETISLDFKIDQGLQNIIYTWFKDSVKIAETSRPVLEIKNCEVSHQGDYSCEIRSTHSSLSHLVLQVGKVDIQIKNCITIRDLTFEIESNECIRGASVRVNEESLEVLNGPLTCYLSSDNISYSALLPSTIDGVKPGDYTLILEDVNKCSVTFTNSVNIPNPTNCTLSFTPNGDGLEDTFFIDRTGRATIYGIDGQLVNSFNVPTHWDGTDQEGQHVPMGLYIILIDDKEQLEVVVIQ